MKRVLIGTGLAAGLLLLLASPASAQETDPVTARHAGGEPALDRHRRGARHLHAGRLRARRDRLLPGQARRARRVSTNFAIFGLGFVGFFLVGYAFMFGGYSYVLPGFDFGYDDADRRARSSAVGDWVFLWKGGFALDRRDRATRGAVLGFFLYMVAFMDTVATIPTGSMAERWKWKSFVVWGLFCGAIYYPLFGAWTWGGGWLSQLGNSLDLGFGYVDFAGSGVVHAIGGVAALAGAIVLGPRIGKYGADGKPRTLPGHHIPMAMLGTFILLFGWFGFNAASTLAATDVQLRRGRDQHRASPVPSGRSSAMFWIMMRSRQARPRDDGQRHARRPRGDHRPVRLRAAVGRGGHRHRSPASS